MRSVALQPGCRRTVRQPWPTARKRPSPPTFRVLAHPARHNDGRNQRCAACKNNPQQRGHRPNPHHLLHRERRRGRDVIEGLDLGADDYITKPYSLRNVLARIRSVLRRCPGGGGNTSDTYGRISFEGLSVDTPGKRVEADGSEVRLTERNSRFFPCFCETVAAYSPAKKSLPASARRGHRSGPRDRRQHNADMAKR